MKNLFWIIAILCLGACAPKQPLNEEVLSQTIQRYLDKNPIYYTAQVGAGLLSFSTAQQQEILQQYQQLAQQGYLSLRKKTKKSASQMGPLSVETLDDPEDKGLKYTLALTDKAEPYLISKSKGLFILKSCILTTKGIKNIKIEDENKGKAIVTCVLGKEDTPFASLNELNDIAFKKKFRLQYSKELGWQVSRVD